MDVAVSYTHLGPAGLVFAIIIINAVTGFGIKKRKNITKYTVICGIGAVIILSAIYFMLTYIGASTPVSYTHLDVYKRQT